MMKFYRNNTHVYVRTCKQMISGIHIHTSTHVHYAAPHEKILIPIISVCKDFRVKLELKRWLERLCNVKKNK